MALAYVQGVVQAGFQGNTSASTGTLGAAPTSGSIVVIHAVLADVDTGRTFTPPSGFTELDSYNVSAFGGSAVALYKIAGGSEPTSYSFSWTGDSFNQTVWCMEISGPDATTPIDVKATDWTDHGFGSANVTEPAITTVTNAAWDIVAISTQNFATTYAMVTAGYTERVDAAGLAVYTKEITTAGSTGGRVMSHADWVTLTYSFAIRPSGGGGATGHPAMRRLGLGKSLRPVEYGREGTNIFRSIPSGFQRRSSGLLVPA